MSEKKKKLRTYQGKLLSNSKKEKESRIIRGFYLPSPLYDVCLAELKNYGYLKRNFNSMVAAGEKIKRYTETVEKKINIELKLSVIEIAFGQIPDKYHAPMKYMLTTKDTEMMKKINLENCFGLEYKEAREWLKKLVYFYAEAAGYPVPHSGAGYILDVSDEGEVDIVIL